MLRWGLQMVFSVQQETLLPQLALFSKVTNVKYYAGAQSTEDQKVTLACLSASASHRFPSLISKVTAKQFTVETKQHIAQQNCIKQLYCQSPNRSQVWSNFTLYLVRLR